jgi:hypothetical protein
MHLKLPKATLGEEKDHEPDNSTQHRTSDAHADAVAAVTTNAIAT